MAELQKVTFEELPVVGEEPLKSGDILTIMRWAVETGTYIRGLRQGVTETGDEPDLAPLAEPFAQEQEYRERVRKLNSGLLSHFWHSGVRVGARTTGAVSEGEQGIFTLTDGVVVTGQVDGIVGNPIAAAVESATIWLDTGRNASPYPDASVQLLPIHTPIERMDQVDLALRYPQSHQAAA